MSLYVIRFKLSFPPFSFPRNLVLLKIFPLKEREGEVLWFLFRHWLLFFCKLKHQLLCFLRTEIEVVDAAFRLLDDRVRILAIAQEVLCHVAVYFFVAGTCKQRVASIVDMK